MEGEGWGLTKAITDLCGNSENILLDSQADQVLQSLN